MLVSIVGNRGSGKTLLLTIIGCKTKRLIYSNYKIKIKNYNPLEVIDLLTLKDNVEVFIDEGYSWLESRTSSKVLNRYLSYIILQSRKRTIDIYITAQMFSSVDIRFRQQSDVIVHCKRIKDIFYYTFYDLSKPNTSKRFILPFNKAKKYFKLYNTYEIIDSYEKEALEFSLISKNPKKLLKKVKEVVDIIKPQLSVITHDSIKTALLLNGIEMSYEKYIYIFMKGLINHDTD